MHKVLPIERQLQSFEPMLKSIVRGFFHDDDYKEDALQEARITACEAITTFNANMRCKMSWYISQCVRNRMVDIKRVEKSKRIPIIKYYNTIEDLDNLEFDVSRDTTFNHLDCLEFDNLCKKLLTDTEYNLYKEYVLYGYTYDEIIKNSSCGIEMVKHPRNIKKDIRECLLLIMRKLELKEVNLQSRRS